MGAKGFEFEGQLPMKKWLKAGAAGIAMLSMSESAFAGEACIRHEDMTALKAAAVQQQLMVAALSCRATSLYNRFVLSYRRELQASDDALKAYFVRSTGSEDAYNAFKTRLANASSLSSIGDSRFYCEAAYRSFEDALVTDRRSLEDFVRRQPVSLDLPYSECGDNPRLFARNERWSRRIERVERRRAAVADNDGPLAPQDHELASDAPAY